MRKLHSIAFYALVAPAISLGSTAALAQATTGMDSDRNQQSSQRDQGAMQSSPGSTQGDAHSSRAGQQGDERASRAGQQGDDNSSRAGQLGSQTAADSRNKGDESNKERTGYIGSTPADGMRADNLIGSDVKTTTGESVGPVNDLIIDKDGKVAAIVIGVGGFLGMGERDVAIGWDDVTRSGDSDDLELRIDATRDELSSATEFNDRN